ncbi:MAG: rhodanese-like domain-containing protein [Eubacteriales bacterium]|nr:rhodanese-like domain-containing protein [Eubacteriales bacterium]MDY3333287.1 rhodanese-like domain-containing protein [Gallibacter sp.]
MSSLKQNKMYLLVLLIIPLILVGCGKKAATLPEVKSGEFKQLSPKQAEEFIKDAKDNKYIILDVRGENPYKFGHIPGAIYIWYQDLDKGRTDKLPDLEQPILVYCDYGGVSKIAAKKLVEQGYTKVYEFDGLKVWKGEVIVDDEFKEFVEEK